MPPVRQKLKFPGPPPPTLLRPMAEATSLPTGTAVIAEMSDFSIESIFS